MFNTIHTAFPTVYLIPPVLSLVVGLFLATLSIFKAKTNSENILFAIVCIWWSLLAPIFICHHLIADEKTLMIIERSVHFFYVYLPALTFLFIVRMVKSPRPRFTIACFVLSLLISLTTPTELYMQGYYRYRWGYIAKGGPMLSLFGAYCLIAASYAIVISLKKLKEETNSILRLKIKYFSAALGCSSFLTLLNIPAMNGFDFYPYGNMSFIPLGAMAYGVLRYRIMGIRSMLHISAMWLVMSSLILIPNYFLYRLFTLILDPESSVFIISILAVWFVVNLTYIRRVQPKIDRIFNRKKYDLRQIEADFIKYISHLENLNNLQGRLRKILTHTLAFPSVVFFTRKKSGLLFYNQDGETLKIDPDVLDWFAENDHLVERHMVESNPHYTHIRDKFTKIFDTFKCHYIVPMLSQQKLTHLVLLPEKKTLKPISSQEVKFLNTIRASVSISLSNSALFQSVSDLKMNLEKQSEALKAEIETRAQADEELSRHRDHLEELVKERTAELEYKNEMILGSIQYAKKIQRAILPTREQIQAHFPEHFVLFKPRDIVSGDFYWLQRFEDKTFFAVADCTGHGVPGAFMSMIGSSLLNKIVGENMIHTPSDILDTLHIEIVQALKQETGGNELRDGMDVCLCLLDYDQSKLFFSGANLSLYHVKPDPQDAKTLSTIRYKGDRRGIGGYSKKHLTPFSGMDIDIDCGDMFFLATDGFSDQVGANGKRFGTKNLKALFQSGASLDMDTQKQAMIQALASHQQGSDQRDDITVIGIRL